MIVANQKNVTVVVIKYHYQKQEIQEGEKRKIKMLGCRTICDRFFKQIYMLDETRRLYNGCYNRRVVKSVSVTKFIDKDNYLECSRCGIFMKKELAFISSSNGWARCPCCGNPLRRRKRGLNSDTRKVNGRY